MLDPMPDPAPDAAPAPALGRRDFLRLTGLAGLAVTVAVPDALARVAVPPAAASAPPGTPAADSLAHAAAPSGPSADARALAGILQRRFPGRLTDAQWESVTAGLDGRLDSGRRLAERKLANGDEPDFAFKP